MYGWSFLASQTFSEGHTFLLLHVTGLFLCIFRYLGIWGVLTRLENIGRWLVSVYLLEYVAPLWYTEGVGPSTVHHSCMD